MLFGLTSSPFLLQGTIRFHCEKMLREGHVDEKFVKMLLENLYVHDNVNGVQTVLDGYHFYKTSKWLLKSGGG